MKHNYIERFKMYSLKEYQYDILNIGLEKTWIFICNYVLLNKNSNEFLNFSNFTELYEIGLALSNKQQKKITVNIILQTI